MFTIINPLILDKRVDEQTKVVSEGKEAVVQRVKLLKNRQTK
jgi:hypothetical protein